MSMTLQLQKIGPFQMGHKNRIAIFSETALTNSIKFQQLMKGLVQNTTGRVINSEK
jgi:hypothetical protein